LTKSSQNANKIQTVGVIYVYYAEQPYYRFSFIITGVTHSIIFDLEFHYSTFSTNVPVVLYNMGVIK